MKSPAEQFAMLDEAERDAFIETLTDDEAEALLYDWRGFLARPDQIAPDGDWDIWLCLAGRGWGKTRTGAEWIREKVDTGKFHRIALVGETIDDAIKVMVEGDSGILSIYPKNEKPKWEPSKKRLTWKNGAVAELYSAAKPDGLRGPQFDLAWSDEIAKWKKARATWDQLQFGLRLGPNPQQIVTTTPRPLEIVKAIISGKEGRVHVTRGKTMDNVANLAGKFLRKIVDKYQGTRLGRQELNAEVLGDLPGALFTIGNFDTYRVDEAPENLGRIVISVDHAVSNTEQSNEHGIIAVGQVEDRAYVLDDASRPGSPNEWARTALALHDKWEADAIVVEVNQGGDLVANTIRSIRPNIKIIEVRASRGKHVRAEPVSALYEQGRVSHAGNFPELEDQASLMTNAGWEGESGSPDRLDALVWGVTALFPSIIRRVEQPKTHTPPKSFKPAASRRGR